MTAFRDITGKRFGLLTAEKFSCRKGLAACWLCKCDCGNTIEVLLNNLRSGNTKSCGCLNHRTGKSSAVFKHGVGNEKAEYRTWNGIKSRCYNKKALKYPIYGGRGITVCDRWLESFENFYADMGEKPSPQHSIDRIDNNKGYSPENCRWATATTQARNKNMYKNNPSGHTGVIFNNRINKWNCTIGVNNMLKHMGAFDSIEDAMAERKAAELKYWGTDGK